MKRPLFALHCVVWLLLAGPGHGDFALPQAAPVERLLRSARLYLAAHPAEADAHYTLGRIHYLAFARGAREVPVLREVGAAEKPAIASDGAIAFELYDARQKRADELALKDIGEAGPRPSTDKASAFEEARGRRARQLEEQDWHPAGNLPVNELTLHALAALAEFREASRLEPKSGLPVLALALLHEKVARWVLATKPPNLPSALRPLSLTGAREAYLHAYRLAITTELALPARPASGLASLVSQQAGEAYLRLADHDRAKLKAPEKAALDEVRGGLKRLKKLRIGPILPL